MYTTSVHLLPTILSKPGTSFIKKKSLICSWNFKIISLKNAGYPKKQKQRLSQSHLQLLWSINRKSTLSHSSFLVTYVISALTWVHSGFSKGPRGEDKLKPMVEEKWSQAVDWGLIVGWQSLVLKMTIDLKSVS